MHPTPSSAEMQRDGTLRFVKNTTVSKEEESFRLAILGSRILFLDGCDIVQDRLYGGVAIRRVGGIYSPSVLSFACTT